MITIPLEADMLNGTPWVEEIRSTSLPGLSSSVLVFEKGTDIMRARQVVQERLTRVSALPKVAKLPVMINPVSSASRFMTIGLKSDTLSLIDMSVLARWTILPRLMGLPGVANVSIWGERKWQLQVQVDPEHLRDHGVKLAQVIKTAGNALWASPLSFLHASTPGTGGWVETANQRLGIQHVQPIQKAADLAQMSIDGTPSKRLGDVATVVENHQPLIGDSIVDDVPSLTLVLERFPWANTADTTDEVEDALEALAPGLSGLEMDPTLFRQATYLDRAHHNISIALLAGALLLIGALFALLWNWRAAVISTVSVVASLLAAATVLYLRGESLNLIVLAGFTIALAILIDDAIVDVDNIARRLRRASGGKPAAVILEAALEMRIPLLYATVILVLAALPLLAVENVAGALLQPLTISYLLALLASMTVAITVTPAVSLLLLRRAPLAMGESPAVRLLRDTYHVLFGWATRARFAAVVAVGAIALAGLAVMPPLRGESLLPALNETDLVIQLQAASGASHPAMSRAATEASRRLRAIPGVRKVSAHVGRAVASDKRNNVDAGELWVSLDPSANYDATVAAVRLTMSGSSSLSADVRSYHQAKLREEMEDQDESVVVRVYGQDLKQVRAKADEIQQGIAKVEGVAASSVRYPKETPILEIEVDIERAKSHGLTPGEVRRTATSLVSGIEVGSLFEQQKVFDVVVWGSPQTRQSVASVQQLLIETPAGGYVRLQDVAQVRTVSAASEIRRDAVSRFMDVTAQVDGRDVSAVAADVRRILQEVKYPLEYRAELMDDYEVRSAGEQRVLALAIAAGIGILLLLQAYVRNWALAATVLLTLPASLAGGVMVAALIGEGVLSFGSIAGLLAVLGISVRNGVGLVGSYRRLEQFKIDVSDAELVQRATEERAAPILMSAIATVVALLPFALAGNVAGMEIGRQIAMVVLGGLVTTTVVSLAGIPAIALLCGAASPEPDLEFAPEVPASAATV